MAVPSADMRFRTMYEENYGAIRDYCLRRLRSQDAVDAAAEVFTTAWRRIDTVPSGTETRLWLFGVARNVVAHQLRRRRRQSRLNARLGSVTTVGEAVSDVESVVVRHSQEEQVISAIERLKPADQEVLRLKMWEELSHEAISAVLGISAHAVDMRVQRAIRRLGKLLKSKVTVRPHPIPEGGEL